jgi:hypothetical protein
MNHAWKLPKRPRPLIAIAAAYSVVLQILLVAFASVTLGAAQPGADGFVICHGNTAAPIDHPGPTDDQLHKSPCALCCLGSASPAILPVDAGARVLAETGTPVRWTVVPRVVSNKPRLPRLSQGPPFVA